MSSAFEYGVLEEGDSLNMQGGGGCGSINTALVFPRGTFVGIMVAKATFATSLLLAVRLRENGFT